jgi:membrane protein implicated in regulation of membrane protease activity
MAEFLALLLFAMLIVTLVLIVMFLGVLYCLVSAIIASVRRLVSWHRARRARKQPKQAEPVVHDQYTQEAIEEAEYWLFSREREVE